MGHQLDAATTSVRRSGGDVASVRSSPKTLGPRVLPPFRGRWPVDGADLNAPTHLPARPPTHPLLPQELDDKRRKSVAAISRGLSTPELPPGVSLQHRPRSIGRVIPISRPSDFW